MKLIFLYGPDGCGKTFIAKQLSKKLDNVVIIPFEPRRFGSLNKIIDSGYNGEGSAVKKSIPLLYSLLLFLRYLVRIIFFKVKYSSSFKYAIFTRGPLEFGINDTHKNFPKFFGRLLQRSISSNFFILIRPVDFILKDKPELPRLRILNLYEKYLISKCYPILNINQDECTKDILKSLK